MIERTFVMLKPDALERGLAGRILSIFEDAGFEILAARLFSPAREIIERHYVSDAEYLKSLGDKTIASSVADGEDIKDKFGSDDPIRIGEIIRGRLIEYMTSGPVMPMVIQGNCAVRIVRKLCGATYPVDADPSTIRGRFCCESLDISAAEKRSVRNLIHASGTVAEAVAEIALWFPELAVAK